MLGGGANSAATTTAKRSSKKNSSSTIKQNDSSSSSSRRFSDEQIKSLESLFKMENKLEPRKKLEMARELGLHPRQVAIWFQNRRARWKSKQVEHDYTTLKADYDTLTHRFQSLQKEKHDLLQQLSNICSQLKEPYEGGSENGELNNIGNSVSLKGGGFISEGEGPLMVEHQQAIYSDEEYYYNDPSCSSRSNHNNDQRLHKQDQLEEDEEEEEEPVNINTNQNQQVGETDVVFEELGGSLFDQSSCGSTSTWWDIWPSN